MPLTKSTPAKQWIHDFVHSKNKKFEGKSKKERIKQALGAYYAKQRNESYVFENHDSEAHELHTYADNHSRLYKTSHVPVAKNLEKKFKKGTYDHEKAKKLWKYHADRAAHEYAKEHGSPGQKGHHIFSSTARKNAASRMADAHHAEMKAGNFHEGIDHITEKAKWRSSSAVEPNPRHDEYEYDKKDPYRTSPIKSKADTEHPYASLSTRPQPHIATKGPNKGKMTKQSAASLKNRIKASLHHEETHTGKVPPSTVSATEGAMKTPNPKYRNMVMVTLKQPKTLKGKLSKKGGGGVFRIHKDTYNANRTKYDLAEAPDAALAQQQKQVDQRKEQLKKQIAARVAQKQMQVMQQKAQKRLSMIKAGDNAVEIKNMKGKCSCNHEDTTNCPVHGKSDQATAKKTIVDMNPQSMY